MYIYVHSVWTERSIYDKAEKTANSFRWNVKARATFYFFNIISLTDAQWVFRHTDSYNRIINEVSVFITCKAANGLCMQSKFLESSRIWTCRIRVQYTYGGERRRPHQHQQTSFAVCSFSLVYGNTFSSFPSVFVTRTYNYWDGTKFRFVQNRRGRVTL